MIKVTLIRPASRRFFLAQWSDPITGLTKTRSTKQTVRREAERSAARLEDELNSGEFKTASATTFQELCDRYADEVSSTKRIKTAKKTKSTFNAIKRLLNPRFASSLADPSVISKFAAALRAEALKEADNQSSGTKRRPMTIDGHLREIRKVMRWAKSMHIIHTVPAIEFPKGQAGMKGRPITAEEFERMKACVGSGKRRKGWVTSKGQRKETIASIVAPEFEERWLHYLDGLWLSGLRLEESVKLHWTDDSEIAVDFSHRRPMFRIQASADKSGKYRLLPMVPDFASFLHLTPPSERKGFVFQPLTYSQGGRPVPHRPTANHVGRLICALGKAAMVRVNDTGKAASAQDLRRAFGSRWCKIVMPAVLQKLMRHASIETTMKYYVGSFAEDAADEVYRAVAQRSGNTSGNTGQTDDFQTPSESSQTSDK